MESYLYTVLSETNTHKVDFKKERLNSSQLQRLQPMFSWLFGFKAVVRLRDKVVCSGGARLLSSQWPGSRENLRKGLGQDIHFKDTTPSSAYLLNYISLPSFLPTMS